VLIETCFAAEVHPVLRAQGDMHLQSFLYSQKLIEKARQQVKESPAPGEDYQAVVRDQGFGRAVLRIYDHRCTASSAMRRTVVDAVHCGLRQPR
jgi:predicted restriction endonuclease